MSAIVDELVEKISGLSLLEASELKTALEDKFGVTAAAPMAMGVMPGAGPAAEAEEEKTEFDVELTEIGSAKINVIKAVREILGLGLKEAKETVDGAPSVIKEGIQKDEAESIQKKLEEVGAKVTLK